MTTPRVAIHDDRRYIKLKYTVQLASSRADSRPDGLPYVGMVSPKLPKRAIGERYSFDDEIRLEYYRLQKISEGSISLREGKAEPLDGPREVGSGARHDEDVPLARLIDVINERFGTDFTDSDQLFFDQIIEAAIADGSLQEAAAVNPEGKFALLFSGLLETLFIERMEQNEDIFARFMNERDFQSLVSDWISRQVYGRLRVANGKDSPQSAGTASLLGL
ncbi:hypothetical protein LP416_17990 [Polaromonas sp. P2-4]|nr:hypothetical protein LP416_17990 [Polaromonas sp. P2-4]